MGLSVDSRYMVKIMIQNNLSEKGLKQENWVFAGFFWVGVWINNVIILVLLRFSSRRYSINCCSQHVQSYKIKREILI